MKKLASTTALALAVIVLARPASAQSYGSSYHPGNAIRLDLGAFQPEASSSYWDGVFEDFRGDKNDFRDVSFGVEYQRDLSGPWLLMAGIHGFDTTVTQSYRRFVDNNDRPIRHDTNLQLATATFGFAVRLSPRGAPVVPYLGAGAALVSWELEEKGDFIDFEAQPRRVFSARFNDDGVAYGWYGLVGLEVPVSSAMSFFAEGRWTDAEDDLSGDFEDLGKLDLSGRALSAGVSWRF